MFYIFIKSSFKIHRRTVFQREFNRFSFCRRFINSQYQFQRSFSCFRVHIRRSVFLYRRHHVSVKRRMAIAVYIRRIVTECFLYLFRVVQIIRKIPFFNNVYRMSSCFNRSLLPKYIQSFFQILREYIGRSFDNTVTAVGKFHKGNTHILRINIIMV